MLDERYGHGDDVLKEDENESRSRVQGADVASDRSVRTHTSEALSVGRDLLYCR